MKRLVMAVAALCAADVLAMPTKADLTKAQALVVELMAPVMEAYKNAAAKDKLSAAVKVGDASSEFAGSAETEAAKFLLLKGAVNFYARGEAYDKAADTVIALQQAVKDVPPTVIAEIAGKATGKISETKAPRLYAQYRAAKLQVCAAEEAKALSVKLKKVKSDALQRRYAEALAVSGDWKAAYAEFAKVNDAKMKPVIEAEAAGKARNVESGEFWWSYTPALADSEDFFKAHAVTFFRQALAAGEITGLKKNVIQQRLATVAAEAAPTVAKTTEDDALAVVKAAKDDVRAAPVPAAVKPAGKPIVLNLTRDLVMEFVPCPAGEFEMGNSAAKESPTYRHKVKITRPFWIGKYQVTRQVWQQFSSDIRLNELKIECGGMKAPMVDMSYRSVEGFCDWLQHRYGTKVKMPKGYVFRLPTEAEWEYALDAGGDPNDDYHKWLAGDESLRSKIMITKDDYQKIIDKTKVKFPALYHCPALTVGQKKPNAWGVYDMLGNGGEFVLDCVSDVGYKPGLPCRGLYGTDLLRYEDEEVDPLRYKTEPKLPKGKKPADGEGRCMLVRNFTDIPNADWYAKGRGGTLWGYGMNKTFRLVIGPDLVSEWKAKHGKK